VRSTPPRDKGSKGEVLAEQWLRKRLGAEILERNFHSPFGEIDLVVRLEGCLAFVEVKTRESVSWGSPEESVTETKKERLRKSALFYLMRRGYDPERTAFRFDVVAIHLHGRKTEIRHYPSAF
jgi:putative endonuclease